MKLETDDVPFFFVWVAVFFIATVALATWTYKAGYYEGRDEVQERYRTQYNCEKIQPKAP